MINNLLSLHCCFWHVYIKFIPPAVIASRFIRQLIFLPHGVTVFTTGQMYHPSTQEGGQKYSPLFIHLLTAAETGIKQWRTAALLCLINSSVFKSDRKVTLKSLTCVEFFHSVFIHQISVTIFGFITAKCILWDDAVCIFFLSLPKGCNMELKPLKDAVMFHVYPLVWAKLSKQ